MTRVLCGRSAPLALSNRRALTTAWRRRIIVGPPGQAPAGPHRSTQASLASYSVAASRLQAADISARHCATRSATGTTAFTAPMPWPQPQMSFQAFLEPPPPPKSILLGSLSGRWSGSMPALGSMA